MAITNTVSSNLLSAFIDCLDCFFYCCLSGVINISDHVPPWDLKHENVTYKTCARLQPPPPFGVGVGLRLVAACRNSNRDMYIVCIFIRSATFNHQNTE